MTRCVELREPWPRDENAGEDGDASKRLDERDRLAESRPGEARRGDRLQEDDERRESRRQPAERDSKQPLPSRMADPGHDDERREPCSGARQDCRLGHESDDEENGRCDQRRFESDPRGRRRLPRRLHGKEVEAVEDPSRDAEEVADRSGRLELEALRQQRRAAEQAQAEANEDLRFQALAAEEPAEQHDPDRRGRREESGVGDARVRDRRVPEDEGPGEGQAREDRRGREALRRPPAPVRESRPGPQQRQSQRHAPEGTREGADVGEPHRDRRDSDRHGPHDERREGREPGKRPREVGLADVRRPRGPGRSNWQAKGKPLLRSVHCRLLDRLGPVALSRGCSLVGVAASSRPCNGRVTGGPAA